MIQEFKEKYQELAAQKRAELEGALERREVEDPTGGLLTAVLISAAISAAVSAASYVLSMALAPKPPKQTIGKLQGSLSLQNSEQGIMIPEIYGAGPAGSTVAGASPTWQNKTNCTSGANGSITKTSGANNNFNAGASHNIAITAGQDAFIRVIRGTGFAAVGFFSTATPTGSGDVETDLVFGVTWHPDGPVFSIINGADFESGHTVIGDEFTVELRSGRFHLYQGTAEVLSFGAAIPAPTFPLYFGVIMYTTGAGVSDAKVKIDAIGDPPNYSKGGMRVPAIIDWSSGIRKHVSTTQHQVGGKGFMGGQTQTTENITYDIDLGLMFCRGPVNLLREYANADVLVDRTITSLLLTGLYNPSTGADPDYDPDLPPDPKDNYVTARTRNDASLSIGGDGVGTGTVQGGGSSIAVYPGNDTQDPDPTEEADIDSKYGTGSTTAHRGKARIVHTNFDLSRWGGIVPNMTAAWEHQTLTNLSLIYASLCERVNVKTANGDYDFSGLATIKPRGMLISGRLFSPAEVMDSPEIKTVYNYFVTEAEGQIKGYIEGAEPSVTIPDTQIGWMDSDADPVDILPEVETIMASEVGLARQVDVKYIDLDKEWESNTQSDNRQITEGVSTDVLEVQLALLASEARTTAQRKLYRDYVAGSVHKFTLPWTYLYLYPGYRVTVTRAEGFSHVMKLTSISGGLGVLECEGVAIEPAAFTQPAVPSWGNGIQPVQSIPAMTILTFLDTPFLRDPDEKRDNVGYYVCGTPRTGQGQSWRGFALFQNRNNNWNAVPGGSSTLPGTIGTIVSATTLTTGDTSVFDRTGVFVVDLYGTEASLSSVTETDVLADPHLNQAMFGDMCSQFVTATQVAGFPNRWSISLLLNGRRGTGSHITDSFTGARFVLIDAAVVLVNALVTDINQTMEYRAVTSGQSLTDAATIDFAWTGGTVKPLPPDALRGERDSDNNLLILWNRRTRMGAGMKPWSDVPLAEEEEKYLFEVYDGATLKRAWNVITGMGLAALLESNNDLNKFADITVNTLQISSVNTVRARSLQVINETGNYVEATLSITGNGKAGIGLVASAADWKTLAATTAASYYAELNSPSGSSSTLKFFVNGVEVYSESGGGWSTFRIRIILSGSEVRFVKNWVGPATPPQYVSAVAPSFPLHALGQVSTSVGGTYKVEKVVMTINPQPATIYTAAQQALDFGVVQSQVKVHVSQISAIVGQGGYAEAYLGAFAPSDIVGLKLWLKADSLGLADGTAISSWTDSSGNANHATQGTGANQPLMKTGIINGLPVVRFDQTNDSLVTPNFSLTQPYTVFVVTKFNQALSGGDTIFDGLTINTGLLYRKTSTDMEMYAGANGPLKTTTPESFHIYGAVFTGASSELRLEGGAAATGNPSTGVPGGLTLNTRGGGTSPGGQDMAEVIVYNSVLSTEDRQAVETYLRNKYAL